MPCRILDLRLLSMGRTEGEKHHKCSKSPGSHLRPHTVPMRPAQLNRRCRKSVASTAGAGYDRGSRTKGKGLWPRQVFLSRAAVQRQKALMREGSIDWSEARFPRGGARGRAAISVASRKSPSGRFASGRQNRGETPPRVRYLFCALLGNRPVWRAR